MSGHSVSAQLAIRDVRREDEAKICLPPLSDTGIYLMSRVSSSTGIIVHSTRVRQPPSVILGLRFLQFRNTPNELM